MEPAAPPRLLDWPEMRPAVVDLSVVERHFGDLAFDTSVLAVLLPRATGEPAPEPAPTLRTARDALLSGAVDSVQIRYVHAGVEWWETIARSGTSIRLVRIRK